VVHSRLSYGAALTNAGRAEEALELLQTCLRSHPDHSDVHNSIGMALGKLGRHQEAAVDIEAAVHIVQAVRLGHPQAAETMRKLDMDYCRECHRSVYRTPPAQADVHVIEPTIGMECTACHDSVLHSLASRTSRIQSSSRPARDAAAGSCRWNARAAERGDAVPVAPDTARGARGGAW
jgi:tetratricopeptide (TPR) repeat protein